jgi:acyl-CoA reductase-like NAD-dependent aldehyde dehydrogenase
LNNRPVQLNTALAVWGKHNSIEATRVALAGPREIEKATVAAVQAGSAMRKLPAHQRAAVLHHVAHRLEERTDELAHVLAIEAGKPIRDARGEIARGVDTFRISAEEATRIHGEYLPLDISARADGYEGICKRVPIGPCAFITPFNFPINLAAHKIGPAIAAGCPFVLKPASTTPISAILLGEMLAETDLPAGAFSILPCRGKDAEVLATDERFKLLSFTGSGDVGWRLKSIAGKKQVILELGGNAACIVDRDIDEEYAAARLMIGAFYQSGQSCISVQRIMVHTSIYDRFKARLVAEARKLKFGDPLDESTFLGPLISEDDAKRVETWVQHAVGRGAQVLCGGKRHGSFYEATLVENVPDDAELSCSEVFGPVATIEPFTDFADACQRVNASRYGLQAGVFTRNLNSAFYAFNELEVGGVIINDIPSFRVDSMPYGGVKDSGIGREGVRYAIEHLTERRLMVLNRVGRSAT